MRVTRLLSASLLTALLAPAALSAQKKDSAQTDLERRATLARKGAGLHVGPWMTTGLQKASGADYSTIPSFEGYFRKGLDKHLALDNSVGLWRRSATLTSSGGLGGGSSTQKVDAYVIPLFTGLTLFPATTPDDVLEPFVQGAGGFAIGVEQRSGGSGALFDSGDAPPAMILGFGLRGAVGAERRMGQAFGVHASAGYQWIRFTDKVGGEEAYKGPTVALGLTYRFQY